MIEHIKASIETAASLFKEFAADDSKLVILERISQNITRIFKAGNKILICGNGGSATDAMHFAEECTGRFRKNRKALAVIPLTDASHITCVANDLGFEEIFSRAVEAYGKPGDMLIVISTSGNSPNLVRACSKAKQIGLQTFALLGKDGGKLRELCDLELLVPGTTTDRIQELHIAVLHIIVEMVERLLFPDNYRS